MTGTPASAEAMAAAEAAWIEREGTVAGCAGLAHAAWAEAWNARGEYDAQLAAQHDVTVILPGGPFGTGIKTPFGSLLRQEGGGT